MRRVLCVEMRRKWQLELLILASLLLMLLLELLLLMMKVEVKAAPENSIARR